METFNFATMTISLLSAAIAGLALYLQWAMRRPRILGRVNQLVLSNMATEQDPEAKQTLAVMVHVSLTNRGRDPIHIIDYEIKLDTGDGYQPLPRFAWIKELELPLDGWQVEINNWRELQVFYPYRPVEFGTPLTGFLIAGFPFPKPVSHAEIREFLGTIRSVRVTLKDVFGKVSQFDALQSNFVSLEKLLWLLEMSGARISREVIQEAESNT